MSKKLIGVVVALLIVVAGVNARDIEYWSSTANGTAKITTDDAGTATITADASVITAQQSTTIELGHATDTTLSRASAGVAAVEGKNVYVVGGADVAVTDGGTGVGTLTGLVKGNGTSAFSAATANTDYVPVTYPKWNITASANVTSNTFAVAAIASKNIILKSLGTNYAVTLPAPTVAGQELIVIADSTQGAACTFIVPDDGTRVECGADTTNGPNDVMYFVALSTSKWLCIGIQNND